MSFQGDHCLLIELKLCHAITCIGGKTGEGAGRKLGTVAPGTSPEPCLDFGSDLDHELDPGNFVESAALADVCSLQSLQLLLLVIKLIQRQKRHLRTTISFPWGPLGKSDEPERWAMKCLYTDALFISFIRQTHPQWQRSVGCRRRLPNSRPSVSISSSRRRSRTGGLACGTECETAAVGTCSPAPLQTAARGSS